MKPFYFRQVHESNNPPYFELNRWRDKNPISVHRNNNYSPKYPGHSNDQQFENNRELHPLEPFNNKQEIELSLFYKAMGYNHFQLEDQDGNVWPVSEDPFDDMLRANGGWFPIHGKFQIRVAGTAVGLVLIELIDLNKGS